MVERVLINSQTSALMGGYSPLAMMVIDPFSDQLLAANRAACELLRIPQRRIGPESEEHKSEEQNGLEQGLPLSSPFSHRLSASLPLWVSFTGEALEQKTAWSDDLVVLDMLRQPYRVEVYAQRIDESEQLLLSSRYSSVSKSRIN